MRTPCFSKIEHKECSSIEGNIEPIMNETSFSPDQGFDQYSNPPEKLPAEIVSNRVLYVNQDFPELPFQIQENESSKLGLLIMKTGEEKAPQLEVGEIHSRSALYGKVLFKDKQNRKYRDLDLKGVRCIRRDYFNTGRRYRVYIKPKLEAGYTEGILTLEDAEHDMEISERFLDKGIRTHRVIAIIKLEEILDNKGVKIPIAEAKQRGLLLEDDEPVIAVRAYGTKKRIEEADPGAIKDARELVAAEENLKLQEFGNKEYFNWLLKTIAEQVALIHKNGWYYEGPSPHNITLDGRFTDFDSVGELENLDGKTRAKKIEVDLEDALYSLRILSDKLGLTTQPGNLYYHNLKDRFMKVYDKVIQR